jgi:hypothetical protein
VVEELVPEKRADEEENDDADGRVVHRDHKRDGELVYGEREEKLVLWWFCIKSVVVVMAQRVTESQKRSIAARRSKY